MPRRSILSAAERTSLLALPDTQDELIRHYAALLHKSKSTRDSPNPRRGYAMEATGTVVGHPSCVKRLSKATRTCNSTT